MNIWEAYCKPAYYNVYFDILVAKGMKRENAEELKHQYNVYIQRLKNCRLASDLKQCTTPDTFKAKLTGVFFEKWRNNMKFREMPKLFEDYLTFLDSMQALHNDFICQDEKCRLIDPNMDLPIKRLTHYELEYMKDGKLVALMNPMLLSILREFIEVDKLSTTKVTSVCRTFYGDLLPNMKSEDYIRLLNVLWDSSRRIKKGGKHKQFKISFSNGKEETLTTLDGMKRIVLHYGFDECVKQKIVIQGYHFLVKHVPQGLEEIYEKINHGEYIILKGHTKDRLNAVRRLNMHFGNELKIEIV